MRLISDSDSNVDRTSSINFSLRSETQSAHTQTNTVPDIAYNTRGFFIRRYVIPDKSVAVVSLPAIMTNSFRNISLMLHDGFTYVYAQ
jgi:hypothetical protein